eukprot:scaffold580_cov257-Alexandrium_tamarense.AAC.3
MYTRRVSEHHRHGDANLDPNTPNEAHLCTPSDITTTSPAAASATSTAADDRLTSTLHGCNSWGCSERGVLTKSEPPMVSKS